MTTYTRDDMLRLFEVVLPRAWSRRTSNDPDNWSQLNFAWGQCAPTALLVKRVFGGKVMLTTVEAPSPKFLGGKHTYRHYYNVLDDGTEVDLTRQQYQPETTKFHVRAGEPRVRTLPFGSNVARRLVLLRQRVEQLLELDLDEWRREAETAAPGDFAGQIEVVT